VDVRTLPMPVVLATPLLLASSGYPRPSYASSARNPLLFASSEYLSSSKTARSCCLSVVDARVLTPPGSRETAGSAGGP
jgi:hypothetical protein